MLRNMDPRYGGFHTWEIPKMNGYDAESHLNVSKYPSFEKFPYNDVEVKADETYLNICSDTERLQVIRSVITLENGGIEHL